MDVTRADVMQIARLAKLRLEPDEVDRLAIELNDILAHVRELATIDVTGVAPFSHAVDDVSSADADTDAGADTDATPLPLRADEGPADTLHATPDVFGTDVRSGFFTVPRLPAQQQPDRVDNGVTGES
ncbi:hypothetical protein BH23GEM10_BH23GEM10_06120 [soil metagenome]